MRPIALGLSLLSLPSLVSAAEPHAAAIVRRILDSKRQLEASPACRDGCVFLSAWDFDGTILKGDASEGLYERAAVVYPGLAEKCIEAGLSSLYKKDEFPRFWRDYETLDRTAGHIPAYTFLPKMLKGAPAAEVQRLAADYYRRVLRPYYFTSSVEMFQGLKQGGVVPYVISAAPDVFVRTAGPTLGIDDGHIYGIAVAVGADGRLTDRILEPIPYAEGKARRLAMIVQQERVRSGKPVYVLAAFGNSYHTDSGFLQWTLNQPLPAARPTAVMINGGPPPPDLAGRFLEVTQQSLLRRP